MNKIISEKQLEANRVNALKGGVKTREGKEKSKMNALKYGVYSPVLFNETEKFAYQAFIGHLIEEYEPKGLSEESLVSQIALYEVKIHRILYMEEYFNLMASMDNVLSARNMFPRESSMSLEDNSIKGTMYELLMNASEILKVKNLEQIESMQKYREMLENRKARCLNELMKIKYFKKNIIT